MAASCCRGAVDAGYHPLKVYAGLELGIGAAGLLLLWGMPLVNTLYAAVGGGHIVLRALIAAVCLLPPTLMMGATLPAIARWVETTPAGMSWLGVFYAGNIGGAVLGSLLAGFYLLRVHDMAIATYAAAGAERERRADRSAAVDARAVSAGGRRTGGVERGRRTRGPRHGRFTWRLRCQGSRRLLRRSSGRACYRSCSARPSTPSP